jgi:hypothetical protein
MLSYWQAKRFSSIVHQNWITYKTIVSELLISFAEKKIFFEVGN